MRLALGERMAAVEVVGAQAFLYQVKDQGQGTGEAGFW